ncbi:15519_t:CDS:10, partial [Dentiscutata erythropus]
HIVNFKNKFLVFLWNKTNQKLEIFFGTIIHLRKVIKAKESLKKLNLGKSFMFAANEPKGLIAIYDNDKGVLNSYSLDEEQSNIYLIYRNIQIQRWYNDEIPKIAHFFFIKNTENICFVETNSQARIYNFVNDCFQPGVAQFPNNICKVMSTPDGTKFTQDISIGDFIVINNEQRQVIEIKSDIELKISAELFKTIEYNKVYSFTIEQRKILNVIDSENLDLDEYKIKFRKYISGTFEKLKKETNKPIGHLKKFKTNCASFKNLDLTNMYTEYKLGEWLIDFFCLIPLQIAVTRDNKFIPLKDGILLPEIDQMTLDENFGIIESVSDSISFGWYEAIFDYYSTLKVKVISSMGEQSCGKSYLLNHCIGSTFDGSAMRCTEGVWMSLVKTNDTLYVALDFEGLASIERTAQEETFLQLLNAALSNLVLFKSQFAISRDISSMFQRFHDGINYFGDDPDIFQACFCIIIKDVAISDRDDIVIEFQSKLSKIVDTPVFTESAFYTSIRQLKVKLDEQESKYKNARMFLEKIKILMTKLKMQNWGSIQETMIVKRASELKRFLSNAIAFGYEQKEDDPFSIFEDSNHQDIRRLTNRDNGKLIPDDEFSLSEIFKNTDNSIKLIPDTGLVLFKDKGDFTKISSDLRTFFEKNVHTRGSIPDSEWLDHLDKFFKLFINRRIKRVREWILQNISNFPKDHTEVTLINYALNQEINKFNSFWNICRLCCSKCGQACLKASKHDFDGDKEHDCLTDHKCHSFCQCVRDHKNGVMPECIKSAAHKDRHKCAQTHRCDAPCIYADKINCKKICSKDYGHQKVAGNEVHLCESKHYCGAPCSLDAKTKNGKYQCQNTCIANCRKHCESSDHLHALGKSVNHICGYCHFRCDKCGLRCKKANRHVDKGHDCSTDHKCHAKCQFPESHRDHSLPECNMLAAHEGTHRCSQTHSCGATCIHANKENCQKRCVKDARHVNKVGDETHLCDVKKHYCGAPCSLNFKTLEREYRCQNACIRNIRFISAKMCPIQCSVKGCNKLCESLNHLHAFENVNNHLCGLCHLQCNKCGQMCRKVNQHNDTSHDCLTDHKCHSKCQISESHTDRVFPECNKPAAHKGNHQCAQFHKCNAPCIHTGKANCQNKCVDIFGHQATGNKPHLCGSDKHTCGAPCSLKFNTLKGEYKCRHTLCHSRCDKCGQLCRKADQHDDSSHDCLTDHLCHNLCQLSHSSGNIPECNKSAIHEGRHKCGQLHPCNAICVHSDKRNCQRTCTKILGHQNEHLCISKKHYCVTQCSSNVKGKNKCQKTCTLSYEDGHTTHQC